MRKAELKAFLEEKYERFNRPKFVEDDPVCIPHSFSEPRDQEISGFFAALIAWGRRDIIIRNAQKLMELMDQAPAEFVLEAGEKDLERLDKFVHRTFNGIDAQALVLSLRKIYADGGLESAFAVDTAEDTGPMIVQFRNRMMERVGFPGRTGKHLANPAKGSSAKRLNMFLRWMVRKDGRGVDLGLWTKIKPKQLVCPLDVHTGNVGRELGLLKRKQNDWKAAIELTQNLRKFDADDPVKYDFSLFGLGVNEGFGKTKG